MKFRNKGIGEFIVFRSQIELQKNGEKNGVEQGLNRTRKGQRWLKRMED